VAIAYRKYAIVNQRQEIDALLPIPTQAAIFSAHVTKIHDFEVLAKKIYLESVYLAYGFNWFSVPKRILPNQPIPTIDILRSALETLVVCNLNLRWHC